MAVVTGKPLELQGCAGRVEATGRGVALMTRWAAKTHRDCDILIPAAIGNVINEKNAADIKAKLIIEAANIPTTCIGNAMLEDRGIKIIPDILANAGGVTVSYLSHRRRTR